MDNRNVYKAELKPNNSILIICDHASNDLKFIKPLDSEEPLIRTNEGYDWGAADLACMLSESLQCMAVLTSFSKLIIDPSLPMCNHHLVRQFYQQLDEETKSQVPISFNSNGYRLWERLSSFYLEYFKILNEVCLFLEYPRLVVSIHTHDAELHDSDIHLYRPYTVDNSSPN